MKAHPFLYSSLTAALITAVVAYAILIHGPFPILAAYLIGINLATLLLYRYDKLVAPSKGEYTRIPEVVLLGLALLGGSPGAFLGMTLRPPHKTSKFSFQLAYWLIVIVQVVLAYCVLLDSDDVCQSALDCLIGLLP